MLIRLYLTITSMALVAGSISAAVPQTPSTDSTIGTRSAIAAEKMMENAFVSTDTVAFSSLRIHEDDILIGTQSRLLDVLSKRSPMKKDAPAIRVRIDNVGKVPREAIIINTSEALGVEARATILLPIFPTELAQELRKAKISNQFYMLEIGERFSAPGEMIIRVANTGTIYDVNILENNVVKTTKKNNPDLGDDCFNCIIDDFISGLASSPCSLAGIVVSCASGVGCIGVVIEALTEALCNSAVVCLHQCCFPNVSGSPGSGTYSSTPVNVSIQSTASSCGFGSSIYAHAVVAHLSGTSSWDLIGSGVGGNQNYSWSPPGHGHYLIAYVAVQGSWTGWSIAPTLMPGLEIGEIDYSAGGCTRSICDYDYCNDPNCGPCGVDEGDCDSDSECAGNLVCQHDIGASFGCNSAVDICGTGGTSGCQLSHCDPAYCDDPNCGPCQAGQGDCDIDADCASGLVCSQNVGSQYGCNSSIDVCELPSTSCSLSPCDWDYCSDPSCGPCMAGEGDCDNDSECSSGLVCRTDVGSQYGCDPIADVCEPAGGGGNCTVRSLSCWSSSGGTISSSDCDSSPRGSGYYSEMVTFSGTAGQNVTVSAAWASFDGYLYLVDPQGTLAASNDDYNGLYESRISNYRLTSSGTWTIWATTYARGHGGSYSIQIDCR